MTVAGYSGGGYSAIVDCIFAKRLWGILGTFFLYFINSDNKSFRESFLKMTAL